jgi:starch synthase (maltosyl-transferring)
VTLVQDARSEQPTRHLQGCNRVVIEHVRPQVDCGRFPIKRVVGERVVVQADVFADGHDRVLCQAAYRRDEEAAWTPVPMEPLGNDRWQGEFQVSSLGTYRYTVEGWVDPHFVTRYEKELTVQVDREKARFSTWYELFPRSCSPVPFRHGTFSDCVAWLPYIAAMGFDVLYLPPIHPIGRTFRRGKNNSAATEPRDVGSPWAIGAEEGGHKSVNPELGTLDDFRRLVAHATDFGLEVALDIAFQCSPDHPYVREHPEWFRHRADGSIQYAENPPKKYPDIYPFDFECAQWPALWEELESIFLFWIGQGVRIFRVDNPHTKAFAFWEWAIPDIKDRYPEVILLSEAFTRPRLMYRLAKIGFTQSYTYFAWRNTIQELTDYFTELTQTEVREYFRPSLWPNTPDILNAFLQSGGRPAFMIRLALAATLGANYGLYGPAFELCENTPREPGSEEYLNSEKYELKHRELDAAWSLKDFITRINQIRRDNPALQSDWSLRFHVTDNPLLICYSKATGDLSNVILAVVNLDPFNRQSGWVTLDLAALGLDLARPFAVRDLLGGGYYRWQGPRNYVELTPGSLPAHILLVQQKDV